MSSFRRLLSGANGCEDVLACMYGLNRLETSAYFALLANPDARMDEVAEALDRDRSTVHRAVQTLLDHQLAQRETETLPGGGYYHAYRATEPSVVRERIQARLATFEAAVEEALGAFQDEASEQLDDWHRAGDGRAPRART